MALDFEALLERVRRDLIKADAMQVFQHVYALQEWWLCTVRQPGAPRYWSTPDAISDSPPELIEAVKEAYERLERAQRAVTQGKAS